MLTHLHEISSLSFVLLAPCFYSSSASFRSSCWSSSRPLQDPEPALSLPLDKFLPASSPPPASHSLCLLRDQHPQLLSPSSPYPPCLPLPLCVEARTKKQKFLTAKPRCRERKHKRPRGRVSSRRLSAGLCLLCPHGTKKEQIEDARRHS